MLDFLGWLFFDLLWLNLVPNKKDPEKDNPFSYTRAFFLWLLVLGLLAFWVLMIYVIIRDYQ